MVREYEILEGIAGNWVEARTEQERSANALAEQYDYLQNISEEFSKLEPTAEGYLRALELARDVGKELNDIQKEYLTDTSGMESAAEAFGLSAKQLGKTYKNAQAAQGLLQSGTDFQKLVESGLGPERLLDYLLSNEEDLRKEINDGGERSDDKGQIKQSKLSELLDLIRRSMNAKWRSLLLLSL